MKQVLPRLLRPVAPWGTCTSVNGDMEIIVSDMEIIVMGDIQSCGEDQSVSVNKIIHTCHNAWLFLTMLSSKILVQFLHRRKILCFKIYMGPTLLYDNKVFSRTIATCYSNSHRM